MLRSTFCLAAALIGAQAWADGDACTGYKWDVAQEHALFSGMQTSLTAGTSAAGATLIEPARLYSVQLSPASEVTFAAAPGRSSETAASFAGLLRLKVPAAGLYRISVDQPIWLDVVSGVKLLTPSDYEGVHGCNSPRKIVVFALDPGAVLLLQLSSAQAPSVRLSLTRAP